MRRDLITDDMIKNNIMYGIQFDRIGGGDHGDVYIKCNKNFKVKYNLHSVKFAKGIESDKYDLYYNKVSSSTFTFDDLYNDGKKVTFIFKYKIVNWVGNLILARNNGQFGFSINYYVNNGLFGVYNYPPRSWFTDGGAVGHTKNVVHEFALECEESKYYKIWIDGNLHRHYTNTQCNLHKIFSFENEVDALQCYFNDIFITNKTGFLPNTYTVDLNNYWYDNQYKILMNHDNEIYN